MFRTIVLSAAGAGVAVCLAVGAVQLVTTEPLILHAEEFEQAGAAVHDHDAATPVAHAHDKEAWAPADGFERTAHSFLANFLVGAAVSLMLLGAMVLKGEAIDARRGLMWGVAGFFAASLLPGLGLPPELPGTPAADLVPRQAWWLFTAAASAAGIYALAFARHWGWRVAGVALLVLPHAIGAPVPPSHEAAYPAGLAGEFVVAVILVSALTWSLAGLAAGWLYQRLSRTG